MANIRFVRVGANPDDWQFDCFVLPSDETNGELVHRRPNTVKDFRGTVEPGIYSALDDLLDRISSGSDIPREEVRLTLATLRNQTRTYHSLRAFDDYPPNSPEREIWKLIDALYDKALEGLGQSQ